MSLLLHPRTVGTRSRWWYMQLWQYAPKRRFTADEAALIVARNWHLAARDIANGARYI